MKDFKLCKINLETDKPQIASWDTLLRDSENYESIFKFVLEDGTINGLGEVIETNYELFAIGRNETKNTFVAKTAEGEILGFVILSAFELNTSSPELFLQYVVVNPMYQHQGYGKEMLTQLFLRFKQNIGVKPKSIFAYIHKDNESSKQLFKHFGFEFGEVPKTDFLCAKTDGKSLKQNIEAEKSTPNF